MTQFGRAAKNLGIEIICANILQAKGRVERANLTLQDRLVIASPLGKELRPRNIATIEAGNAFVPEYIQDFKRRFAVQPRSSQDAHRPLLFSEDELNLTFLLQETRILSTNLPIQYNKVICQIQTTRPTYALHKAPLTFCEKALAEITILYKDNPWNYSIFRKQQRQAQALTSKEIDTYLNKQTKPNKPAADHPWRQYGRRINSKPVQKVVSHGHD